MDRNMMESLEMLCVISVGVSGEEEIHDIQMNSGWKDNPYGEAYAVVPKEMAAEISETAGFCDITTEDGIVTGFTARNRTAEE